MDAERRNFDLGLPQMAEHLRSTRSFTVGDLLTKNARIAGTRPAIADGEGYRISYRQLNDRVNRFANALCRRGLGYGHRVLILSENRPEYIESMYAGAKLGMLVAGMNWRWEKPEIRRCVKDLDPDLVLLSARHRDLFRSSVPEGEMDAEVIGFDTIDGEAALYEHVLEGSSASEPDLDQPVEPEDGLAVLFTSGTTGPPKGAVISHRAFLARAMVTIQLELFRREAPDFIGWTPMFHMGALDPVFSVGMNGGCYYPVDGFKPDRLVKLLRTSKTSFLPLVPATVEPLVERLQRGEESPQDFPHLRYVGVMADLIPPRQIQQITRLLNARYLNSFGSTETGYPPATGNSVPVDVVPEPGELSKQESPYCRIKLVDDQHRAVEVGEVGELLIKGPTLFSGYLGEVQANRNQFEDGWFRTGDMFLRNPEGTLNFVDRRKYMIKCGGENIYPSELEEQLLRHEDIQECVVVRVPDEKWGEVPKIYLRPKTPHQLRPRDLLTYLEGKIARYKLPHYIEFVTDRTFPRSTSGKIIRAEVENWPPKNQIRIRSP